MFSPETLQRLLALVDTTRAAYLRRVAFGGVEPAEARAHLAELDRLRDDVLREIHERGRR